MRCFGEISPWHNFKIFCELRLNEVFFYFFLSFLNRAKEYNLTKNKHRLSRAELIIIVSSTLFVFFPSSYPGLYAGFFWWGRKYCAKSLLATIICAAGGSNLGPEKNFASRNTRLGDQLLWKKEATSRQISFVLQKSIGRIQRNSNFEF